MWIICNKNQKGQKNYIATQGPLNNTIEDFWYALTSIIADRFLLEWGFEKLYFFKENDFGTAHNSNCYVNSSQRKSKKKYSETEF
jgi:hypothetical protein